jgi:4-diphosphocytidyl-2-C-methyl-D-erythritol kinase
MLLFPNCKINLGLNIVGKREDGYHDIETVFYPVGLKDALEGIKSGVGQGTGEGVAFSSSGLAIAGNADDNLCVKAYQVLKKDFPGISPVQLHLHKAIPMGAGLGGGSADGAFTLLLIDQLYDLNLSKEQLIDYALQLGSDCPFFILNKPCLARRPWRSAERN